MIQTDKNGVALFGATNVGKVRTNNEDNLIWQTLWDDSHYLAVAIDGMGGYEGGEVAAAIAHDKIIEYLETYPNGERIELLKQAVTFANNAIVDRRETSTELSSMGCVLTAILVEVKAKRVNMVHVGDSRLYMFSENKLVKLSHDHSLVGYREEQGELTEEEAMNHPQRSVISRDVGSERHEVNDHNFLESDIFPLEPETTFLLCSDGLPDMITSAQITSVLQSEHNIEDRVNGLIDAALVAGGKDNVTAVLLEYSPQVEKPQPTAAEPVREQMADKHRDKKSTHKEEKKQPQRTEVRLDENTPPSDSSTHSGNKRLPIFLFLLLIAMCMGFGVGYLVFNDKKGADASSKENVIHDTIRDTVYLSDTSAKDLLPRSK
ncbi:MAG: serine/threonine-protein phosphatase [Bacteroidales bacterium]|nr:serine/threonine-protein phosphatase [Bacteroidales bacterium]